MVCRRPALSVLVTTVLLFLVSIPVCHTSVIRSPSSPSSRTITHHSNTKSSSATTQLDSLTPAVAVKKSSNTRPPSPPVGRRVSTATPPRLAFGPAPAPAPARKSLDSADANRQQRPLSSSSSSSSSLTSSAAASTSTSTSALTRTSASSSFSSWSKSYNGEPGGAYDTGSAGDVNDNETEMMNAAAAAGVDLDALEASFEPVIRVGACPCAKKVQFRKRFFESYGAVRAIMVSSDVLSGAHTAVELVEYTFKSEVNFGRPRPLLVNGKRFKVHAYSNPNFCGMTFVRHVEYLLYLDDPGRNSAAGNTGQNTFYVDQCSQAYVYKGMTASQKSFLRSKLNRK